MIDRTRHLPSCARHLAAILALIGLGCLVTPAQDIVYLTSFTAGGVNVCPVGSPGACFTLNPLELTPAPVISQSGSTEITAAPGVPTRSRTIYGLTNASSSSAINWSVMPTLNVAGATYKIETAHNSGTAASTSCSTNVTVTVFSADGAVSESCTNTPVFQRAYGGPVWNTIGYITNNPGVSQPTLVFYQSGGVVNGSPNRLYIDAFKFTEVTSCSGVAGDVAITGPLAANQSFVNVTGVTAGATNVTIYADGGEIGQTNFAAGFAAGSLTVPTSPLNQGSEIKAQQTKNGCISALPSSGPPVGSGANPIVKVSLGLAQNAALAGPTGANSSGAATANYWLKATALAGGSATAPIGGQALTPSACWQTVTFSWQTDPALNWASAAVVTETNPFASLDNLTFAIDTDSGPYDIYVDDIKNGDTVIENFEGYDNGTPNVTFQNPNFAVIPGTASTYLSAPNATAVSQSHSFEGTNACRIQWQFANALNIRWARVVAAGVSAGRQYPQLDTSKPVTMKILVLPVGGTSDQKFVGTVSAITNSPPTYTTQTNVLGITVTGPGTYTYQWSWSGGGLANATTDSTYTIDGLGIGASASDNGTYTVTVSDGNCSETRSVSINVLDPNPTITNQPAHAIINQGNTLAVMSVGATGHVPLGYPLTHQWRSNNVDIPGQNLETLWLTNASVADVLSYDVVVANPYGSVTSAVATVDVVPAGIMSGTGTGLRADYRSNHFPTNAFSGAPTLTRTDALVNFDWLTGPPVAGVSADNFTVRWTGQIQALGDDTYTVSTISDDGVRLWVNSQLLVNNWTLHSRTTNSGTMALTGMNKYDITMEFFEAGSDAVAKLYWSNASGSVGFEPVPQSQLYPAPAGVNVPTLTYSQPDATHITFSWGVGTYNLAWATTLDGPFTNIIYGVSSPHSISIGNEPEKYFRLLVE